MAVFKQEYAIQQVISDAIEWSQEMLPEELLLEILKFLSANQLIKLLTVNKTWEMLISTSMNLFPKFADQFLINISKRFQKINSDYKLIPIIKTLDDLNILAKMLNDEDAHALSKAVKYITRKFATDSRKQTNIFTYIASAFFGFLAILYYKNFLSLKNSIADNHEISMEIKKSQELQKLIDSLIETQCVTGSCNVDEQNFITRIELENSLEHLNSKLNHLQSIMSILENRYLSSMSVIKYCLIVIFITIIIIPLFRVFNNVHEARRKHQDDIINTANDAEKNFPKVFRAKLKTKITMFWNVTDRSLISDKLGSNISEEVNHPLSMMRK